MICLSAISIGLKPLGITLILSLLTVYCELISFFENSETVKIHFELLHNLGIKIDVILGDFDRIDFQKEYLGKIQFPIEVIHTPDQDKTDLEKAIDFLIDRGFPAANIVWATGRRADHTFANISILPKYLKTIKLTILDDYSTIYPVGPLPAVFRKWFKAQTPLSLIPISRVSHLSTSNLKYELKNE